MIESQERPAEDRLTAEYAAERGARVSDVRYALEFTLEETPERFSGRADIRFDLAHAANSLTLDFSEGDVSAVRINGEDATVDYNGAFVRLPAESLVPGDNRVQIEFGHDYSRTGQGLHRFEDPEDGRVYIHTHFEPYDANRLFPGFDQPDLKARFTLEVSAPAAWHIVSASRESAIETEASGGAGISRKRAPSAPTFFRCMRASTESGNRRPATYRCACTHARASPATCSPTTGST